MHDRRYCVYIMTNALNSVLYPGVTTDLKHRAFQHKNGEGGIFTRKYNATKLVYYEVADDASTAIARERQIQDGSRQTKIELITSLNPEWQDLYDRLEGTASR